MKNSARIPTIVGVLLTGALTLGLAACSGDSKDPDATPSTGASSSPGAVDPSRVSPSDLPSVPVLGSEKGGDLKDLTLGDCNTEAGEQKVDASLTSTLDSPQDFVVSLSWTTSANDVMGRGFKVLRNVAPGETREFTIKAKVAEGAAVCVPGVSYGSMKG
jgi:hypothetical protein